MVIFMEKTQFSEPVVFFQCEAFSLSNTYKCSSEGKCNGVTVRWGDRPYILNVPEIDMLKA
jgi:hypothetical protein